MDWSLIPSLSALRAFEAAARRGSFSAAARELNVTHAAIAQHVRGLEAEFATTLMIRSGQGMAATDTGAALARGLAEGFGAIAAAVSAARRPDLPRPLRVTLTPSFAESWLTPRLADFWARHPEIALSLLPDPEVVDPVREGIDIAIRFGAGGWPGCEATPLLPAPFVVVCGSGARRPRGELGALQSMRWLFSNVNAEQRIWGATLGLDFAALDIAELPTNGMVLAAVRAGAGITVQPRTLVEADLDEGRLIALIEGESGGLGYHIVRQPGARRPEATRFVAWLRRQANAARSR
jgi:LysR family glycine cleavage system transcriptional activator